MKVSMSIEHEDVEVTLSVTTPFRVSSLEGPGLRLQSSGSCTSDEAEMLLEEALRHSVADSLHEANANIRVALGEMILSQMRRSRSVDSFTQSVEGAPAAASSSEASPKSLDQISDTARLIYERREKLNKKFTFGELLKRDWKGLTTRDHVWLALDELIDAGLLSVTAERTGGRPTKKYSWLSNEPTTKGL